MYMNGLHLGKILDAVVGAEAGELSHRLTVGAARIGIADVRVGGCYYVMDEAGSVHGTRGNWRLVACVA
jgi:hypothetical protein